MDFQAAVVAAHIVAVVDMVVVIVMDHVEDSRVKIRRHSAAQTTESKLLVRQLALWIWLQSFAVLYQVVFLRYLSLLVG